MKRYATKREGGVMYIESDEEWIPVGTEDDIVALAGGEEYVIEYDPEYSVFFDWLAADEDGRVTFDVLETIEMMTHPDEFVDRLDATPMERTESGYPHRTVRFVETLTTIWDSKGELDESSDR